MQIEQKIMEVQGQLITAKDQGALRERIARLEEARGSAWAYCLEGAEAPEDLVD